MTEFKRMIKKDKNLIWKNLPTASGVAPSESAQPQQDWREDAD